MEVDFLERKKGKMTVAEAGRRGGLKTAKTYGEQFYRKIGRKGGKKGGLKEKQKTQKLEASRAT